jgi:hypothetical protein
MAPQAIKELLNGQHFKPFSVTLPDGSSIVIPTTDHAHLTPSGRRLLVFTDDDQMRIIDPILIPELKVALN